MLGDDQRVSLADLSAVGVRLRATEAVTIVRELIQQVARGSVPGVPSAHVIRLSPSGQITVEGPVAAGGRAVSRAATLLEPLLPPFDAPPEFRAPGALRLILARALGTMDLPPYESIEDFARALERFSEPDAELTVRRLTATWARAARLAAEAPAPPAPGEFEQPRTSRESDRATTSAALALRDPASLTISDIRRARRATGLPLAQVSVRSRIPVPLLRQLEWGYLHNWPTGLYGRTQLVRYARAAGLDADIVTSTVWPLLEQLERDRLAAEAAAAQEPSAPEAQVVAVEAVDPADVPLAGEVVPDAADLPLEDVPLGHVEPAEPAAPGVEPRRGRSRVRNAAAALLAAAVVAAWLAIPGVREALPSLDWQLPGTTAGAGNQTAAPATAASHSSDPLLPAGEKRTGPGEARAEPGTDTPAAAHESAHAPGSTQPSAEPAARLVSDRGALPEGVPADGLTEGETAWSPALATVGSARFYHAQDNRDEASALMRTEAGGDGAILRITRVVDDNARNYHARPSPDGSKIAFDSDRDGERAVYVADADGSNVRRVSGDGFAAVPSWSPDGRQLAFVRAEPDRPRVWNLWVVDLETGDLRRVTSHRSGQPWGASWFPDGRRIAYSHEDRLVVLDLQSGGEQVYPSPRKGRLVRTPAVSPDGDRVIFQVYRDGAWLLDLSDGSMRKVLADPTAEEYAWSPDGRRVAYHSRRSGQWGVWLMLDR